MTNKSFVYTRLQSSDSNNSPSFRNHATSRDSDSSSEDSDPLATKLRRLPKTHKDRWPGAASHSTPSNLLPDIQWDYVDYLVKPGETLQGIALQYHCTVFELKRANNIVKEVEFHARRIIKIPVRQHSQLYESICPPGPDHERAAASVRDKLASSTATTDFLDQVDQDLQRIKERARVYDIDHDDSGSGGQSDTFWQQRTKRSDCSGDDCGLSWTHLLSIALLLLLACPLLYFLHLELQPKAEGLNATHANTTSSAINSGAVLTTVDAVTSLRPVAVAQTTPLRSAVTPSLKPIPIE